jgi:anti-anti-sigma factor
MLRRLAIVEVEEGVIAAEQLNLTLSLRGTREIREKYQIIRLTGLLDAYSEQAFLKTVISCLHKGPKNLILVLSQIDFIDSSGLGVLVQIVKATKDEGGNLQIVTNARVTQTVKLARLESYLPLHPSLEAALEKVEA